MLNILILSGGTGSIALTQGLKEYSQNINITTLINCYDDGLSTGVCRNVCDVLGPSDFRKRVCQIYKLTHKDYDKKIVEFFENRYDLNGSDTLDKCINLIEKWNLPFKRYIEHFFTLPLSHTIDYKDFNIANIVISSMFKMDGYENTISFFQKFLDISDKVILNSYDNLILKARTKNRKILEDEASIVDFNNAGDMIDSIFFSKQDSIEYGLNPIAIEEINKADIIIISAGTLWSSLIPTLDYKNLNDVINESKAHKILIMNNSEDLDCIGCSNLDIIDVYSRYLSIEDWNIFINEDADDNLKLKRVTKNYKYLSLGNINGKHNADILAFECLKDYYNLTNKPELLLCDFDDTLYTRDESSVEKVNISRDNLLKFNRIASKLPSVLTSGNSYKRIYDKLSYSFGSLLNVNFRIFADGGLVEYSKPNNNDSVKKYFFTQEDKDKIVKVLDKFNLTDKLSYRGPSEEESIIISIRPLSKAYRVLLEAYVSDLVLIGTNFKAYITGTSTIDIMHKEVNKKLLFSFNPEWKDLYSIYVGDEIDTGNDTEIAETCSSYYQVKSVEDTNLFFTILEKCL
jgi:2-phospho-L-lactate transferase/gluconeogenesis factor (CofD/UPF0052 family)